jgi:hypothetical protein
MQLSGCSSLYHLEPCASSSLRSGLLAWIFRFGWTSLERWFTQFSVSTQVVVVIGCLLIATFSAAIIQALVKPTQHLLEGYWPRWMGGVSRLFTQWQLRPLVYAEHRLVELSEREFTEHELQEIEDLRQFIRNHPQKPHLRPTQLGNVQQAVNDQLQRKYGMIVEICRPRLWLLLPEQVRNELATALSNVEAAVGIWLWSVFFLVWGIWAWWAIPVGLLGSWFAYKQVISTAKVYGSLLEAAFDLYRIKLYEALHWPLPTETATEPEQGRKLTRYLYLGVYLGESVQFDYSKISEK